MLLEDAVTALQSSGWHTQAHSIFSSSLVNKKFALLDSPHSSFSQCSKRHQSGDSFHCQLLQLPPSLLRAHGCYMPKLHPNCLDSQSGSSFNALVSFSWSLQWYPIERSLAVVSTTCQRSLCKNSHFKD